MLHSHMRSAYLSYAVRYHSRNGRPDQGESTGRMYHSIFISQTISVMSIQSKSGLDREVRERRKDAGSRCLT